MANKPLKTIKFPGLVDTFTIPEIDDTLSVSGMAADAAAVSTAIDGIIYADDQAGTDATIPLNADTLGGHLPSDFAPASHVEDTNNPHAVTATQVGARADTWLPTIAEIGAAPAGYGFGEYLLASGRSIAAAEGETVAAYCDRIDSVLSQMEAYTAKIVMARCVNSLGNFYYASGNCVAVLYKISNDVASLATIGAKHNWSIQKINGVWQEPEWVNPPMTVGVEYRTTERYKGYPVYTKVLDLGACPSGTTSTPAYSIVTLNISGSWSVIHHAAYVRDSGTYVSLPYENPSATEPRRLWSYCTSNSLVLCSNFENSYTSGGAQIWYIKEAV